MQFFFCCSLQINISEETGGSQKGEKPAGKTQSGLDYDNLKKSVQEKLYDAKMRKYEDARISNAQQRTKIQSAKPMQNEDYAKVGVIFLKRTKRELKHYLFSIGIIHYNAITNYQATSTSTTFTTKDFRIFDRLYLNL